MPWDPAVASVSQAWGEGRSVHTGPAVPIYDSCSHRSPAMSQWHNEQYLGRYCPHPPERRWGHTALKYDGNHRRAEAEAEGCSNVLLPFYVRPRTYTYEQAPGEQATSPHAAGACPTPREEEGRHRAP